ncbi:MAG: VWA domain-containing protein [Bacteroidaceae bacterium]|nr:VWA domain-containing protein [Bacteroidaceae bacterium]
MTFANPLYLYLLLLLIPAIAWYIWKQKGAQASLQVSATQAFNKLPVTYKSYLRHFRFFLRLLALICVIIALARPQSSSSWQNSTTEGIDIILALDVSTSMWAQDFKPDRLEAAKDVAAAFINGRRNDNIGLVEFAAEGFTLCPMTTDHAILLNQLKEVQCGVLEDGTAIGVGLATAINRIKDGQAKSKTIILLTDGSNNRGQVSPATAAEIAATYGIRVYTIGVGTRGMAPYPARTPFGTIVTQQVEVDIDENTLKQIAATTGGEYFRATDENALEKVFEEIDKLEKTKMSVKEFSKKEEEYLVWAIAAFILLCFEILLRNTVLKNIP